MKHFIGIILFLLGWGVIQAQEMQVPFLANPEIMEFTSNMNISLSLFDTPGFERANLYLAADSTYAVEIYRRDGERILRERRPIDGSELAKIRAALMEYRPIVERQVNFCDVPEIDFIDAKMNDEMELLPAEAGFEIAYLYMKPDSTFTLEVHKNGVYGKLVERRPIDKKRLDVIREALSRKRTATDSTEEDKARARYLRSCFIAYVGLHSWAIPKSLGLKGPDVWWGCVFSTLMYGIDQQVTKRYKVTPGVQTLSAHGFYGGAALGEELVLMFSDKGRYGGVVVGSVAGHVLGWGLARKFRFNEADGKCIGTMGTYGAALGFTCGTLTGHPERRTIAGLGILGQTAGYWSGIRLGRTGKLTVGDVLALRADLYYAPLIASLIYSVKDDPKKNEYIAPVLIGSAIGLADGIHIAMTDDFSRAQGVVYELISPAAAFLSWGLASIAKSSPDATRLIVVGSVIGLNRLTLHEIRKDNRWDDRRPLLGLDRLHFDASGVLARQTLGDRYHGSLVSASWEF
jgi:hypothetical protein